MPALTEFSPYIDLALAHLPLTLLAVAFLFAMLTRAVMPKPHSGGSIVEVLFRSYLFWTLLLLFLSDALALGAFGPDAAAALGAPAPAPNPQAADASLAFAVIAFFALSGSLGLRVAAVIGAGVTILLPLVGPVPTADLAMAHLPEVSVIGVGLLFLLVQWGGSFAPAATHAPAMTHEAPPRPTTPEAAPA